MGKNVIITGAASGIGLACAQRLIKDGNRVAVMDIAIDDLESIFLEMTSVFPIRLDLESEESCKQAVGRAAEALGHVDALVHFAGIWTGTPWQHSSSAEWQKVLSVNLTGSFVLAQTVAQQMVKRGNGGSIVLTSSDAAHLGGVAAGAAYTASKGGVISLTRSLARALGVHGIRVNAISPGMVESPMITTFPRELIEQAISRTPLGRIAKPDDVGDVACFLISNDARFIDGQVIEVNGGFYFN